MGAVVYMHSRYIKAKEQFDEIEDTAQNSEPVWTITQIDKCTNSTKPLFYVINKVQIYIQNYINLQAEVSWFMTCIIL